jgi:hypothetical protein
MSKKTIYRVVAIILVVATALGVTGAAFAAPAETEPDARVRLAGEILSLSDPNFVVRDGVGGVYTVHTTGATQWHNLSGFGDLQVGMRVGVGGVLQGNGTITAFNVGVRASFRLAGIVTGTSDHSLTVDTRSGRTVTVLWNASTRCVIYGRGDGAESNSACARIQTGDHVAAAGERDGDTLVANWIAARAHRPAVPPSTDGARP